MVVTQSGSGSDGYVPRRYEAEVYAKVAGAEANKSVWNPERQDPAVIAGKYSNKSAELYARKIAAEGGATGISAVLQASWQGPIAGPGSRQMSIVPVSQTVASLAGGSTAVPRVRFPFGM